MLNSIPKWKTKLFVWGKRGNLNSPILHITCSTLHLPLINLVLNTGVPLNYKDDEGKTPLAHMLVDHGHWVEPAMDEIFRLFIDKGCRISDDHSLNYPLVHYIVFAGKVNVLDYAINAGSFIACNEDGLLHVAIQSAAQEMVRYLMRKLPLEIVGNPFTTFKFPSIPLGTAWISEKHEHLYHERPQSAIRRAMQNSWDCLGILLNVAFNRFHNMLSQSIDVGSDISYCYMNKTDQIRLVKFYLAYNFEHSCARTSDNKAKILKELLHSTIQIVSSVLLESSFWFLYTPCYFRLKCRGLWDNDNYSDNEQESSKDINNSDSPKIDLFSAWHFIDYHDLLEVIFDFCFSFFIDLRSCSHCDDGVRGVSTSDVFSMMDKESIEFRSNDGIKERNDKEHHNILTGLQFACMFVQKEATLRKILDANKC